MTTTVANFFLRVAYDLQEPNGTFAAAAWSVDEMLGYLNVAEREFLSLTGVLKTDVTIPVEEDSSIRFNRPDNTMDIDRISYNGRHLKRVTSLDLELEDRDWRLHTEGRPSYWHEDEMPAAQFELNKIPAYEGTLRIFADSLPPLYTEISGNIHLRDCWEPYLRWKVVSLCLAKDSEEQDLGRAKYARSRFMMGVNMARRLMTAVSSTGVAK